MNTTKKRNNPSDFINQMLGRPVEVKLNDNDTSFVGTLRCLDGTMNVLLADVREMVGGQKADEWKELLIRGNNVMYIKKAY